jgi:hypothetical protein
VNEAVETRDVPFCSQSTVAVAVAVVQDIHMVPDKVPWALCALGFQVLGTHLCGSETNEASKLGDTGFILEHSLMPTPLIQGHQWWRSMTACAQHSGQSRVEDLRWRGNRPPKPRRETNISQEICPT